MPGAEHFIAQTLLPYSSPPEPAGRDNRAILLIPKRIDSRILCLGAVHAQLPSGRHVSIVSDSIFELIRLGNWGTNLQLSNHDKAPEDFAALINVVYYNAVDEDGELGKPYFSCFMLSDIAPDKCDWPAADVAFFQGWLGEAYVQDVLFCFAPRCRRKNSEQVEQNWSNTTNRF